MSQVMCPVRDCGRRRPSILQSGHREKLPAVISGVRRKRGSDRKVRVLVWSLCICLCVYETLRARARAEIESEVFWQASYSN